MPLTVKGIARLTKKPGRYRDRETRGLYLQVTERGTASWLLRYELNHKERFMGLGPYPTFSLKEARERATKERQKLADGIDPIETRKAARAAAALEAAKALTFENAARQYFNQHAEKWTNAKARSQFLNTLRDYAFLKIGPLSVAAIDTGQVLRVIEPIWKTKTRTADRVRGRIEAVLDWCAVRGFRQGDNPARWKGHLDNVLPAKGAIAKPVHHASLPYAEIPAFMATLREREGVAANALEFAVLTAARTNEILGATWDEIDLTTKTRTVPASRSKTKREHRVPLADRAVEILKALPPEPGNPVVFVGPQGGALAHTSLADTLRRMGRQETVHGFRSSFRDWAAEQTNYANHIVEMALAHSIGNAVEKAYRRGDLFEKRVRLMRDWSQYCATTPAKATGSVVPIRGTA